MGNGRVKLEGEILAETVAEELIRADTCRTKVQMVLKEFDCFMEPILHIDRHKIVAEVKFIANPKIINLAGKSHG
jgi:hypothetical protein